MVSNLQKGAPIKVFTILSNEKTSFKNIDKRAMKKDFHFTCSQIENGPRVEIKLGWTFFYRSNALEVHAEDMWE